jgi:nucleoside-diphosphate-sugar epimerase
MRMLVTGGAGFIGSELCKALALMGHDVTAYDIKEWKFGKIDRIEPVYGNTLEGEHLKGQIRKVDMVFHLAAIPFIPDGYVNPRKVIETDVIGTLNVLLALKEHRIPYVHYSSSEAYGNAVYNPIDEKHPTVPRSTYAVGKLAAERMAFTFCHEHDVPFTILRQFNVYGPDDTHPRLIPVIISQLYNGNTVKLGHIYTSRDFTYVTDAVDACLKTIGNPNINGETINVGSNRTIRGVDLVPKIAKMMEKEATIEEDKTKLRPLDVDLLCCCNSKARQLLGWEPKIDLNEGLSNIIKWRKVNRFEWEE